MSHYGQVRGPEKVGLENPDATSLPLAPEVPDKVRNQLDALAAKIASGEIEVSIEYEGPELSVEQKYACNRFWRPR